MRLFVAIELSDSVKQALGDLVRRLQPCGTKAAWVRQENMHLTLRFRGEVGDNEAERLGAILEARYAGMCPFGLEVSSVGVFPNARRPAVVWAGVSSERGSNEKTAPVELLDVWRVAEDAALAIRLPKETKTFHPHLTLGRVKDPKQPGDLMAYLENERGFCGGDFPVEHVALFSSELTPNGPIHRLVKEFPF